MAVAPDGATRVAKNGYQYTKANGKWELSHRLLAEKILGRPLRKGERVIFIDGDRTNIIEENIQIQATESTKENRIAYLRHKIRTFQQELEDLLGET